VGAVRSTVQVLPYRPCALPWLCGRSVILFVSHRSRMPYHIPIDEFGTDSDRRNPKPGATERTVEVCARRVRRSLVIHSLRRSPATRTPRSFVFGCAGVSGGRRGGVRTVCRQRPSSLLGVARWPGGDYHSLRPPCTSIRRPRRDSPVVRRARTSAFGCYVGDLWTLGRKLER